MGRKGSQKQAAKPSDATCLTRARGGAHAQLCSNQVKQQQPQQQHQGCTRTATAVTSAAAVPAGPTTRRRSRAAAQKQQEQEHRQSRQRTPEELCWSWLPIALEHPSVSCNLRMLLAAAHTCKDWYTAVQQCKAHSAAIALDPKDSLLQARQLRSFWLWLPKYSGLVGSMNVNVVQGELMGGDRYQKWWWSCIRQAMQAAAAGTTASAVAPPCSAPTTASPAAVLQRSFQLAAFHSNCLADPSVLEALATHSLTRLDIAFKPAGAGTGPALAATLARLSNLQNLSLGSTADGGIIPGSCLAGVEQLSRLTSLKLEGRWRDCQQPLQQMLAMQVGLRELQLSMRGLHGLNITQLTALEELVLERLPAAAALPEQLPHLRLTQADATSMEQLLLLQQLQSLDLHVDYEGHQQLLKVAELPGLQHLTLSYSKLQFVLSAAPVWCQLPQLQALHVLTTGSGSSNNLPSKRQYQAILDSVAACTGLIKLQMSIAAKPPSRQQQQQQMQQQLPEEADEAAAAAGHDYAAHHQEQQQPAQTQKQGLAVCSSLAGLACLQDLRIMCTASLQSGDALALTTLTRLTRLVLHNEGDGVGAEAACGLASSLTQLRHLDLSACGLKSMACLEAIGGLQQLTELRLTGNSLVTGQGLMLLSGLTGLQQLAVDTDREVTAEVARMFMAAFQH